MSRRNRTDTILWWWYLIRRSCIRQQSKMHNPYSSATDSEEQLNHESNPSHGGRTHAAIPTTGLLSGTAPVEPENSASP